MFSLCSATYAKAICIALDAQVAKMDLAAPALGLNLTDSTSTLSTQLTGCKHGADIQPIKMEGSGQNVKIGKNKCI